MGSEMCIRDSITVPDHNIFKVPEKLDVKEAAVAEPTAVSYHAVLLAVEA